MPNTGEKLYHCPACGHLIGWFNCDECARPMGGCVEAGCSWFGFLDDQENSQKCGHQSCDNFSSEPLTEESKQALEGLSSKIHATLDCHKQMKERSGPIYDLSRERSRIIKDAWRAAGSPRKVSMISTKDGVKYVVHRSSGDYEFVTKDEADAWYAWRRERDRLRNELRRKP